MEQVTSCVLAEYKVGINKGRPRIWLDGKRLKEAGFLGGMEYVCAVLPGSEIFCTVGRECPGCGFEIDNHGGGCAFLDRTFRIRKVTGRRDGKPIIDLLGADVEMAFHFPLVKRVRVMFEMGRLTIEAAR